MERLSAPYAARGQGLAAHADGSLCLESGVADCTEELLVRGRLRDSAMAVSGMVSGLTKHFGNGKS